MFDFVNSDAFLLVLHASTSFDAHINKMSGETEFHPIFHFEWNDENIICASHLVNDDILPFVRACLF